jgi:predicted 3-demethylubiquinone-9 3-methyltransferase (glyoxalase superfamily)
MASIQKISPCLWFESHSRPEGSAMVVTFYLDGHEFAALNGGPHFKFNEAISLMVRCESQAEIDYFWDKLGAGGDPNAQQCG